MCFSCLALCICVRAKRGLRWSAEVKKGSFKSERFSMGTVGRKGRFGEMSKGGWIDGGRRYGWNSLFTRQKGISQNKNVCIMLYKYK